jgi:hypothetical protein
MADKLATAFVEIEARTAKLEKEFRGIQKKTTEVTGGMESAFKRVGAVLAASFVVKEAGAFFKTAIKGASDLQETTSKFETVFGKQISKARELEKQLTEGYATSTREARQYLSSIQDLLVPMGMNSDAAAKMSGEVVKLSADLGSFNNLPTEQVMLDIQSALVGNFETMKKYGVVVNATTVQQEALSLGLAKTKEDLTAADKAQAAFSLITKGSTAALGDMQRTSDGAANRMKALSAAFEDNSAAIGEGLLPPLNALLGVFLELVKSTEINSKAISESFTPALEAAIFGVSNFAEVMNGLITSFQLLVQGSQLAFDTFASVIVDSFLVAVEAVEGYVDTMAQIPFIGELFEPASNAVKSFADDIRNVSNAVNDTRDESIEGFTQIGDNAAANMQKIRSVTQDVFNEINGVSKKSAEQRDDG